VRCAWCVRVATSFSSSPLRCATASPPCCLRCYQCSLSKQPRPASSRRGPYAARSCEQRGAPWRVASLRAAVLGPSPSCPATPPTVQRPRHWTGAKRGLLHRPRRIVYRSSSWAVPGLWSTAMRSLLCHRLQPVSQASCFSVQL
jgi:hypothetical protein